MPNSASRIQVRPDAERNGSLEVANSRVSIPRGVIVRKGRPSRCTAVNGGGKARGRREGRKRDRWCVRRIERSHRRLFPACRADDARVHGPQAGLDAISEIAARSPLESYHLFHAVRGTLAAELGRFPEALVHFRRAEALATLPSEREFIARWASLGFAEVVRLSTVRFPASHIALAADGWGGAARVMTGLSVSDDPASPINEFVTRYGAGLQHVAYRVAVDVDFDELSGCLRTMGTELMTEPLRYVDDGGAELTQMFTRPALPYGPFIELIQRRPGMTGTNENDFSVASIDDLYEQYADVSRFLAARTGT